MKKIGILTFHNAYNFGAVLQAYALKEYLQKNSNCTVEIVNYKNEQIEKEKSRWKSLFNNNVIKELARNLLTTPYYLKLDKVFSKFVNKYLTADNEIKKEDLSSLKYDLSISTLVSYASTALYRRIDIRKYIKIKVNVKNILLNSVAVVFVTLSYYFNITILNVAALVIACIYAVGINWKLIKMFFAEIRKYKKEGN